MVGSDIGGKRQAFLYWGTMASSNRDELLSCRFSASSNVCGALEDECLSFQGVVLVCFDDERLHKA